uniref:Squamosa-promoter binding protein-like protein n=1 Tax=Phyllostachys edulis TaxID=38705 RepID=A0A3Q8AYQ3_PHYED|nr:squamosa-promoter binding protein-like protein [Phyllostachys edulis]
MDWDLKMPVSWDLVELEHDAVPAIAVAAAASGIAAAAAVASARGPPSRPECSVDLKLGGLGEFGAPAAAADSRREPAPAKGPAAAAEATASLRAAKRPRPAGGGGGSGSGGAGQCPSCAVDGCKADLSKCRDYHRRHKVCEAHSKTPVVVVSGREMRFCQQCSRFHLLVEFDEAKRSCRKRLDGHNRRRRKPQPDTMNSASFITSQHGTRFSSFTSARPDPNWPEIIKTEENPYYTHQIPLGISSRQRFVGSTCTYTEEGRRFPFLQEGEINFATGVALEASVCQPLLKTVGPPESSSRSKMFSDGLTPGHDSDCALSLLSAPANSSGIDVSRLVEPTEHIPMAQSLVSRLQFGSPSWFARSQASIGAVSTAGFPCPVVESEQLNTVLSSNDNEMNYNGIFHVGVEGSSDGTSPSLPFSWQ